MAKVSKGSAFPFQIAVTSWIDLLGYGAMIAEAEFNPLHPGAAKALKRLRNFHAIVAQHSGRTFRTLVMNDGAVAYRDLSLRGRSVTHDFLVRSWNLFNEIKRQEEAEGYPGARMVIAAGFRMRGRRAGFDATNKLFQSVIRRYQRGEIDVDQALLEAASIRQDFDIIPELQANFAFTKAYVAESSGSAGGLGGANCFVDLALFEPPVPSWIVKGPTIEWSNKRLKLEANFAPILDFLPTKHIRGGPVGVRDGLEVAAHLAKNPDVLNALREAAKP